jgi:hypothetical protein
MKLYPLSLFVLLLVTISIGIYFGVYKTEYFAASDGGALIQLATSHVPTQEELYRKRFL